MKKVAFSSTGKDLNSAMDPRFGRCSYFIIADIESENFEAFENPAVNATGGAGIEAARFISEKGADAIVSGHYGPNAYETLSAAEIIPYTGIQSTIEENFKAFKDNKLQPVGNATVESHFGTRAGVCGGKGMGGGRGMGRGAGQGGGR